MTRRQRGEGSVSQRCDAAKYGCPPLVNGQRAEHKCRGPWVGQLDLGYVNGKRKRRAVYGKSQAEAVRKMTAARREISEHGVTDARPMTVGAWLDHWLTEIAPHEIKQSTIDGSYTSKVDRAKRTIGHLRLDKIAPQHLRGLYAEMADECGRRGCGLRQADHEDAEHEWQGRAHASILQTHRILAHAFTVAQQNDKMARNPAAKDRMSAPKIGRGAVETRPFTVPQMLDLLAAMQGDRLESRWIFALTLGARQGELLGLGWEDIDWQARTVRLARSLTRVRGKGLRFVEPKSAKSQRTLPLSDYLLTSLERRRVAWEAEVAAPAYAYTPTAYGPLAPSGLVWGLLNGKPRDSKVDWSDWTALLDRAAVPHRGTHAARHTVGTMMSAQGAPVKATQNTLGHSQVSLTLNVYTHADVEAMRPWLDKLGEAFGGQAAIEG